MSTRVITGIALAGVLVLASCMQDQSNVPSVPTGPSLGRGTTAPSCSFSVIRNDAKAYFSNPRDEVYGLIDAMQDAYKTGATPELAAAAATGPSFYVLGRLGIATDAGTAAVKGDALAGHKFANSVLLCTGQTTEIDFTGALGASGLFAVRAGTNNTAVISRGRLNNKPMFGAEPTGAQWHATAPYILFYGHPKSTSDFTTETGAGQAFELTEYPNLTFPQVVVNNVLVAGKLKTGVCTMTQGARFLHAHTANSQTTKVILPDALTPDFCDNPPTPGTNVGFKGMMQKVGDFFSPRPLYAFGVGGGSALVSDLSSLGPVTFDDTLRFIVDVPNARVSDTTRVGGQFYNPTIAVKAYAKTSSTPLAGIVITLDVVGNNGSFLDGNKTATTGLDGIAYFPTYKIDKAGGYTITATNNDFGTKTVSNQFNISGQ